jgi:hypothetical protein
MGKNSPGAVVRQDPKPRKKGMPRLWELALRKKFLALTSCVLR